ncbi:hypothetical protein [Falsigemmobacter faecalis]|uniref:Type IV pilus biogenesis n=1 Tax=Falsigemmobacter faecalis TaxID=2488730 RepID=A0A3P3DX73_9RHOB|nr:hypothetical protein [Falsigemmobacter faecalis]RRH77348.1 hypothetical protein EG244_03920 [Falsigemmobacter faecalis]
MKPSFALLFSQDSVGLLHRLPEGWTSLGSVRFDDPDLMDSLGALRGQAQDIAPEGFSSLLILPNSEVLYTAIEAGDADPADRTARVIEALEGRTPYAIGDLVYDWADSNGVIRIAAAARETLAEAESFARDYRFNPAAFAAQPEDGSFEGLAWFGLSEEGAALPEADRPARESGPLVILTAAALFAALPDAEAATEAEAFAEPEPVHDAPAPLVEETAPEPEAASDIDTTEASPLADPLPAAEPEPEPEPEALPEDLALPAPEQAVEPEPEPAPVWQAGPSVERAFATEPEPEAEPLWHSASLSDELASDAEFETDGEPEGEAELPAAAHILEDQQTAAPLYEQSDWAPAPSDVSPAARLLAELATRPQTAGPAPATLAERLAAAAAAEAPEAEPAPPEERPLPSATEDLSISEAIAAESDPAELTESWPGDAEDILAATKDSLAASLNPAPIVAPRAPRPGPKVAAVPAAPDRLRKAMDQGAPRRRAEKTPAPRPATAATPPQLPAPSARVKVRPAATEAEAMTVYGRRRDVGGKPRYLGLAMTGALLALLLAVAIWAAIFLESPADQGAADQTEEILLAQEGDFLTETDLLPAETAEAVPAPAAERPAPLLAEALPEAADAEELADAPLAAALPEAASESTAGLTVDELTLPGTEAPVASLTAPQPVQSASVSSAGQDPAPAPVGALPAVGALYQFDAEGRIIPTAEGVITPDGILLVAARPAKVPPARPAFATPEPAAAAAVPAQAAEGTPTEETTAEVSGSFEPDNRLTRFRPKLRPETAPASEQGAVAAEPEITTAEALVPGAPTRRPAARNAAAESAALRLNDAEKAQSLAEAAAAAASAASLVSAESALSATRRPPARPGALAAAVTPVAAIAVPPQTRQAAAAPAPRRNAAPPNAHDNSMDDDGEPETARAAPGIPTQASVARQATLTRAINLAQVNLIGVFGTTSQRYALVREGGGRVVRIKVGDRVDGGRVTAIGAATLSYQKGGSVRQLALPRG